MTITEEWRENVNKKKVAILTFKENNNYGAFLQAFSLQYTLSKKNYDVEVIDYVRKLTIENSKLIKTWPQYSFKIMIKSIVSFRRNLILNKKAKEVHGKIKLSSKKYYSSDQLKQDQNNWDKFIVGSDQVWNYVNTNFDPSFFLSFVEDDSKKISYAASFGISEIPEKFPKEIEDVNGIGNFKQAYSEYLSSFSSISVREKTGKKIVTELTNKTAEVVLDPTLLITKEEWKKISQVRPVKDKYILIYSLDNKKEFFKQAKILSDKLNMPLKQVFAKPKSKLYGVKNIYANPLEWVEVFYNASYILTDSFHGTAFSINLEKPFRVFYHEGKNTYTRIDNLLEMVGLENQKMTATTVLSGEENIDYTLVRAKLDKQREKSLKYLDRNLE